MVAQPKEKSTWKELLGFVKDAAKENPKDVACIGTLQVIKGAIYGAFPAMSGMVLDAITSAVNAGVAFTAAKAAVGWIAMQGVSEQVNGILGNYSRLVRRIFGDKFSNKLKIKLFEQNLKRPKADFINKSPAYIQSNMGRASSAATSVIMNMPPMVSDIVALGTSMSVLGVINPTLAMGVLGAVGVNLGITKYLENKFKQRRLDNMDTKYKVSAKNVDVMSRVQLVQANNREKEEASALKSRLKDAYDVDHKLQYSMQKNYAFANGFNLLVSTGISLSALYTALQTGDVATFMMVSGSASRVLYTGMNVVSNYKATIQNLSDYKHALKSMDYDKRLEVKTGTKTLENCRGDIELDNVSFAYPDNENPTIKNASVIFKQGQTTAIIGPSGNGKSTLVNLVRHLYDVNEGSIKLDGIDLREFDAGNLNQQIAVVDQDVHFFDTTIKENLRYFAPNATDEEIIECCKKAGIHKEIMEKNKGYDEPMGQDGASLSGGQKQRIAIARAFLKKSPIIILDEPTSGLNKELSARIIGEIKQHAKDKTLIMVTHNPLEIASADRVIAVENGKIVEDGRPRDLIKKENGYMRNLYNDEEDFRNQREYFAKLSGGATLEKNIAELQNIQRPTSVQLKQTRKVLSENPDVYVKLSKVRLKSHQQKKQKNGLTTKDSSFNNCDNSKGNALNFVLSKKISERA